MITKRLAFVFTLKVMLLLINLPVIAQDNYSSDFESQVRAEFDNDIIGMNSLNENSPSAIYWRAKDEMIQRKVFREFHRRQRFTYRPYSPNLYQKRQTYDPRYTDFDPPWYR